MAERWEIDGLPRTINLWDRDIPHLETNLQVLRIGVQEILSERDPEHRELFQNVFALIRSTTEGRRIKLLPRRSTEDTPVEFGFQSMKDLSQTLKGKVGFHDLQPVIYIDETQLFGSSNITAVSQGDRTLSSGNFLQAWEKDMSTQQSRTQVAEENIRDWEEEAQLESIGKDPQKARDFVLARFQARKLAQLLLPFAMAATYYRTVVDKDQENAVEKFPPEGKDMRKIPPEALFIKDGEPLFTHSLRDIHTYWGKRLGFTTEDIEAAIPADIQNIADVGLGDFLLAVRRYEDNNGSNDYYATLQKFFREHPTEDITDENKKSYAIMFRELYKRFIALRALFYKEYPAALDPQARGEQLVELWLANTR